MVRSEFELCSSYEVPPVTAKHNVVPEDGDEYVRTTIQFPETRPFEITMPDGGFEITDAIMVRSATDEMHALHTEDENF